MTLESPKEVDVFKDNATLASVNYNYYGINTVKRKEYEKAITHFKQAVLADSNLAPSHYNLGVCISISIQKYEQSD